LNSYCTKVINGLLIVVAFLYERHFITKDFEKGKMRL
jgi:hypothetical protein